MTSPLILIHGLLGPIDFFAPAELLDGIPVHTPDLLGYRHNRELGGPLTLKAQAEHVTQYIKTHVNEPSYVLGHSVGGAIAMLSAHLEPVWVKGVICVEGNFTLNEAFWCSRIAPLAAKKWAAEYATMQCDPVGWLERSGIHPDKQRIAWASAILTNQPASTVQEMAQAVVKETAAPEYLATIRTVIDRQVPVWLLAGERSAAGWDVPDWIRQAARESMTIPGTGHMMMLENPKEFCAALRSFI